MGRSGDASTILAELTGTGLLFLCLSLGGGGCTAFAGAALLIALKKTLGGTFNPAITIADFIIQDLDIKDALIITAAQCGGAALGALAANHALDGGKPNLPGDGNTDLTIEALFTCMVCLGISFSLEGNDLAYGAAFFAACTAAGSACFNPAIVVGVVLTGDLPWKIIVAEIAGGILAGLLRHVIKQSSGPAEKMVAEFVAAFFLTCVAFKSTHPLPMAACLAFVLCALNATGNSVCATANFFSKRVNLGDTATIMIGQFAGAACAALVLKQLGSGSLSLSTGATRSSMAELIFSAVLAMVVVHGGDLDVGKGLAIALAFFAGSTAASSASGGVLNPAVAFGACVQSAAFGPFAYYAPCEIAGGALGALCMHVIHGTGFGVNAREIAVEEDGEEYRSMM